MDSTSVGFSLDFFNEKNYSDTKYRYCIFKFFIFHFLFLMVLLNLIRTVLIDPGYFEKEYVIMIIIIILSLNFSNILTLTITLNFRKIYILYLNL
jgi:hypothetical protein